MTRRVAILQSNYIPWRGYFDLIDGVDVFVIYDDVQYTKNDWRNRNRIKTPSGLRWLTVPVRHAFLGQAIDAVEIVDEQPWRRAHREALKANYGRAEFFDAMFPALADLLDTPRATLSELNRVLIRWVVDRLSIRTEIVDVRSLKGDGRRTERLLAIVGELGGDVYVSGPAAAAYLDLDAFRSAGIGLEYKSYDYEPYPQLWGAFEGAVTALDLLFNAGPHARDGLKSRSPNTRVV